MYHLKFSTLISLSHSDKHGYDGVPPGIKNYMYGTSTANTNLRNHLLKLHNAEYTQRCEQENWSYATPKVAKPTVGDNRKSALPSFSPEALLDYLVRFVTADDQVSFPRHTHYRSAHSGSPFVLWNVLNSGIFLCCCGRALMTRIYRVVTA